MNSHPIVLLPAFGLVLMTIPAPAVAAEASWRSALTFHASFDGRTEADFARGEPRLFHAAAMNRRGEAQAGLPATSSVRLGKGHGRIGDALHFTKKSGDTVFFHAATNVAYRAGNWSGTVSFWLSTDPAVDLPSGYCDPVQITPRAWNDAAFFVEFEKRTNTVFRLGAYADLKVWNPQNRKWDSIPATEKPLLTVHEPPFGAGRWTHVAFTFERFNSGRPDGMARLFLNGQLVGMISPRQQTFTWDLSQSHVMLGLGYVGFLDELSLFDRVLTPPEIAEIHRAPEALRR